MKWIFGLMFALIACISSARTSSVEQYANLRSSSIYDPNTTNESVNQLLRVGALSQDPTIFKLTLQTINNYAEHQIEEEPGPFGSLPNRSVSQISGLKEKLIDHWRNEHSKYGYNLSEFIIKQMVGNDGTTLDLSALDGRKPRPDRLEEDIKKIVERNVFEEHPWVKIPQSLCVLWPKDDAVHTLIWEIHEKDRSFGSTNLLRLLNLGEFTTLAANRYRIAQLVAYPIGSGSFADEAISLAAKGLALSHPDEAVGNLVRAGFDHIAPRQDVLITLAGYTDAQLDQYYSKLVSLLSAAERSPPLDEPYLRALNRLMPYVNRPFDPPEYRKTTENPLESDDHLQRFTYLRKEGIYNQEISDETLIPMLSEGLDHKDANVVEQTMLALIEYSGAIAVNEFMGMPNRYPLRPLSQVPSLKQSLIDRFKAAQPQDHYNLVTEYSKPVTNGDTSSDSNKLTENLAIAVPVRFGTLQVLCRFWPNDPDIHTLIWQYQADDLSVTSAQMLRFLNTGKFDTIEANNYRISKLDAYVNESGPEGDMVTTMAAQGLALTHPQEAIPILIQTWTKHEKSRADVLITLSGYSRSQLEPYKRTLLPLASVPRDSLPFNEEIQAVLDRLIAIVSE